jgi:hypothetical protein
MALSAHLAAAYRKAEYVVFGEPELVLRIGEPSPELDRLLEAQGAGTAAFVTAANPGGEVMSEEANRAAMAALRASPLVAACQCYAGEGRDPQRKWVPEPSVLVLGISRAEAQTLGRAFAQNAIVFVRKGRAPELVMLRRC